MAVPPHLLMLAANAGKDPKKSGGKIVILIILIVVILMLPMIAMHGIASLAEEGTVDEDFDITKSALYKGILPVYEEYMEELLKEMNEIAEEIEEEYTELVAVEVPDPLDPSKTIVTYEKKCTIDIIIDQRSINMSYIMAYINATDKRVKDSKKYKIKRSVLKNFYNSISTIKTEINDETAYIYNSVLSVEAIAELYFSEDEEKKQVFLISFENYLIFLGNAGLGDGTTGGSGTGTNNNVKDEDYSYAEDLVISPNGMAIPLYLQYEQPWGSNSYGNGTIGSSGCAPTCLAMVATYLTGTTITPDILVDQIGNKYYVSGVGSSWDIFAGVSALYGFSCNNIGISEQAIIDSLQNGRPVICSMGPGTFTKAGHFIVLRGITEDCKVYVNDPNDNARKNHVNTEFDLSLIIREMKNAWCFY